MTYVPGFVHDVFVSYAHADDRAWVEHLLKRLSTELKRSLGIEPTFWMDKTDLSPSDDFRRQIPATIDLSAVFLLLASPSYIRSEYCVLREYPRYSQTIATKRGRFTSSEFINKQFAIRCLLLPVENNEHWELFPGLTDIAFCDNAGTFSHDSPGFEAGFRELAGELRLLLERMRNHSTPVFVCPARPAPALRDAQESLSAELVANGYRIYPDRFTNLREQLRAAALSVFLMGDTYDQTMDELTSVAMNCGKPWIVWCSLAAQDAVDAQLALIHDLEESDSTTKIFLNSTVSSAKLKEEVLDILRPTALANASPSDKPRVYLIYNSRDRGERGNAGQIIRHYIREFDFHQPDDPSQHAARLAGSDGVLLVWGNADESWCAPEFETMIQVSRQARAKGICLFDPPAKKLAVVDEIRRRAADVQILEQFGRFDPVRLEPFFRPIRHGFAAGAR